MNAEQAARIIGRGREKQNGDSWVVPCPCHDDKNPSLSLSDGDGKLLYHCYAGCEVVLERAQPTLQDKPRTQIWRCGYGCSECCGF